MGVNEDCPCVEVVDRLESDVTEIEKITIVIVRVVSRLDDEEFSVEGS